MKSKLFMAIKNVIRNTKKGTVYKKEGFSSSEINVPENDLQLGELRVVYNKETINKKTIVNNGSTPRKPLTSPKNFDKDKFMYDIMRWSKELEMSDEEYRAHQKKETLSEKMELSNMRVIDK